MSISRRVSHHGDLRAALLDAADVLLDAGGDGAVSLREAARMAGVSASAAYRHFADKETLLAALAVRHFGAFGQALASASDGERGRAYVRFALARPGRFRLMFGLLLARADRHPALAAAADAAFARLSGRGESTEAGLRAWSMAHGLAHLLLDGAIVADDAEALAARVLQGPGAPAANR